MIHAGPLLRSLVPDEPEAAMAGGAPDVVIFVLLLAGFLLSLLLAWRYR